MNRNIIVALCGVSLAALAVSAWFTFRTDTVRVPLQQMMDAQTGLGQALAEETIKVTPDHGQVVVLTAGPIAESKQPPDYLWTALESELQKHGIGITTENVLHAWNVGSQEGDQDAIKSLLDRHATANTFVFLVDLPDWVNVMELFPTPLNPKIIAVDHLQQRLKARYGGYFEKANLVALIAFSNHPIPAVTPKKPREWFDRNYQVYTPANYESLLGTDGSNAPQPPHP